MPPVIASSFAMPKRLSQGTALGSTAAAGVFALQNQTEAAIVYSGVQNVSASVAGATGNVVADLNINGGSAFEIRMRAVALGSSEGEVRWSHINPLANQAHIFGGHLVKLAFGNTISAGISGWNSGANGLVRFVSYSQSNGQWGTSNQTGFAGVRMSTGSGSYQYGWVRLKWNDNADPNPYPNSITAVDWAYETTPNTAILAGDMGAVPEPSRALLALAGAGVAFLRRRRKVSQQ